jgi:hypothetical protein
MPDPHITWSQACEGGRMLATLGRVEIGAVFPPAGTPRDSMPWVWRLWLTGLRDQKTDGRAQTELAAKNALAGRVQDWLRAAGLGGQANG